MQRSDQCAPVEKKAIELQKKIRQLLLFPVVVVSVANLVVIALLILVIPKLKDIYPATSASFPIETQLLMAVSGFSAAYWFVVLPIVILGPLLCAWFFLKPFAAMMKKYAVAELAANSLPLVRSGRSIEEALLTSSTPEAKGSLTEEFSALAASENAEKTKGEACLEKIISHSATEFTLLAKRIESFVEPMVIIFLGALIGLIVLGVFHPMAQN